MLVLDTEGTFRPERLKSIAKRFEVDEQLCLENVKIARIYQPDHFDEALCVAERRSHMKVCHAF